MTKRGIINVAGNINKKNKKYRHKRIKTFLKKFIFYLLSLGFLVLVAWMLFFSDFLKVKSISINNEMSDIIKIKQLIKKEVNKKFFNYVPKNNLILVSKSNIELSLKKEFKLIELVKVKKEFPSTISVEIIERQKVFIWCGRSECFLIDESGVAFYELNDIEKDFFKKDMVVVTDKSNKQIILNEKIVPQNLAFFCHQAVLIIEDELKIKMKREVSTPSLMAEEIVLETEEGWKVHLNTAQTIEEQVEILRKILGEEFIKEKRGDLEYIDLRLKGKVIYKFRGSEKEDEDEGKNEEGSVDENSENKKDEKKEKD